MGPNDILVKNAFANNLKNIDVEIPKNKIVVFSGVSGSGKSSLLFDTIYTEAQRQLIETFSTFARTHMPKLSRPDVDEIDNLSTAIVIDQKRMGGNLRSTVGTATEINTYLRLLYSRIGKPFIGPSFLFSFNHPDGMCSDCRGLGKKAIVDIDLFLDRGKSIRDGGIRHPYYKPGSFLWRELTVLGIFDPEKPLNDYSAEELNKLLYSPPFPVEDSAGKLGYTRSFEGIARKIENSIAAKAEDEAEDGKKNVYKQYIKYGECPTCNGVRLNDRALSVKINDKSIADLCKMEQDELLEFLNSLNDKLAAPILSKAKALVAQLIKIGAGYLQLERAVATLSGGESQRVKMAKQLDCNLSDLLYVLDEPSIGLHPRDTERLLEALRGLKKRGNSVYVVEHDPEIIRSAEWIIDMGPQAGVNGGTVVYSGPIAGLADSQGLTAAYLNRAPDKTGPRKKPLGFYKLIGANANNLQNLNVDIPKGVLTCVTGVSGSGKSSLIRECFLKAYPDAIMVDQSPVGKSSRANIATYTGMFDQVRKEFAEHAGTEASLFSFNSEGACPKCNGRGFVSFEMFFLDAVNTICDECEGKRYKQEVLDIKYRDKNIAEVLAMSVDQALEFFSSLKIVSRLKILKKVGLGYLEIGQTLSSLSGGEAQRLKIASELGKSGNIYVMDEPTTGLHMSDIDTLAGIMKNLTAKDNTLIVIEHNLDIIRLADWVIDLGPEGGRNGGNLIFSGTPEELAAREDSITGKYLRKVL